MYSPDLLGGNALYLKGVLAGGKAGGSLPDYNNFIPNLLSMSSSRELPSEYLDLCPVIDDKYRVLFRLGFGRFSKYAPPHAG